VQDPALVGGRERGCHGAADGDRARRTERALPGDLAAQRPAVEQLGDEKRLCGGRAPDVEHRHHVRMTGQRPMIRASRSKRRHDAGSSTAWRTSFTATSRSRIS
jgi:hypothetical protein